MMNTDTSEIDAVLTRLEKIIDWTHEHESPAGYFAAMYFRMTEGVRDEIVSSGFEDGVRMSHFDRLFAEHYFRAFETYQQEGHLTGPWSVAFAQVSSRKTIVLQHLLLGMNAHINFDLAFAVVEQVAGGSMEDLRSDYEIINHIIAINLERIQGALNQVSPALRRIDRLGGMLDEALFSFSVEQARSGAWRFAERLATSSKQDRAALIEIREAKTTQFAHKLAHPRFPVGWLVRGVALLESRDVRRNIGLLRAT